MRARAYGGETPLDAHPKYVQPYTLGERSTRMRLGTVERVAGGGTRFKPFRDSEPAPRQPARSYGPNVGDTVVDLDGQPSLVNRAASMPRPEGT